MGSSQENIGGGRAHRACKVCILARGNVQPLLRPDSQETWDTLLIRCALVFCGRGLNTATIAATSGTVVLQNVWVMMLARFVLVFWRRGPQTETS